MCFGQQKEAKALVPSFGNWDIAGNVPYTTVFERVRATKEGRHANSNGPKDFHQNFHTTNIDANTPFNQSQVEDNSKMAACAMTKQYHAKRFNQAADSHHRSESLSSQRSSIEEMADHIFTESQYAAGVGSPVVSRQSFSSNPSRTSLYSMIRRDLGDNGHLHPVVHKTRKELYTRDGRSIQHVAWDAIPNIQKERMFPNDLSDLKKMDVRKQQQQTKVAGIGMEDKALPKFGDWDIANPNSGMEYTMIFNKIREDKKLTAIKGSSSPTKCAASKAEEDLYNTKMMQKRSNGIWSFLCFKSIS